MNIDVDLQITGSVDLKITGKLSIKNDTVGQPAPLPDPTPAPEPDPSPEPEPDPGPVVEPSPEPDPTPTPTPEPDPSPEPDPTPVPSPIFTPSNDTRKIYVSSSEGNDANSGLAPDQPKKTVAAGIALLRNGFPDWLLLKKGDVWNEGLGAWKKYGRSNAERMIVWAYGSGARPQLRTGAASALKCDGGGGTPSHLHSLTFSGLHFYAHTRDTDGQFFSGKSGSPGVQWLRHATDVTFDDCLIQSYHNGLNVQNYDRTGITRFVVSRCVIIDSYSGSGSHSQGIYASGVDGLVIEDCVFDKNGWNDKADAPPTIFNHNIYLQHDNGLDVIVRRNIICRGSSHGIQMRSGGLCEGNFFYRNPIQVFSGYDTPVDGSTATVRDNVILEATDIISSLPRGWGITLKNLVSATVMRNIVAHVKSSGPNVISIENWPFASYADNVVYNWPTPTASRGKMFDTPGPWVDPNRTPLSYCERLGIPGTESEFFARIRSQSRDNWRSEFTAKEIGDYIRAGFSPL